MAPEVIDQGVRGYGPAVSFPFKSFYSNKNRSTKINRPMFGHLDAQMLKWQQANHRS